MKPLVHHVPRAISAADVVPMTHTHLSRLREIIDGQISFLQNLRAEIDAMAGATAGDQLLDRQILSVQKLSERLRCTEKTARRIGCEAGARFQIGGRVYFDLGAIERHAAPAAPYRVLPSLAVSPELASCDDSSVE